MEIKFKCLLTGEIHQGVLIGNQVFITHVNPTAYAGQTEWDINEVELKPSREVIAYRKQQAYEQADNSETWFYNQQGVKTMVKPALVKTQIKEAHDKALIKHNGYHSFASMLNDTHQ